MAPARGTTTRKPPGLLLRSSSSSSGSPRSYQTLVLALTFLAYACFHMTRKVTSVVKGALDPQAGGAALHARRRDADDAGWMPFSAADGSALLGEVDVAFLAAYAVGMFVAGHVGDRVDLRLFLAAGMLGAAAFTALFGAGYWLGVHGFGYFLAVQTASGLFQSVGWPSVVAVVGNWFGKSGRRGLIMGAWNAHTSVGNIAGSLLAASLLRFGWGWSFAVPSLIMALVAFAVFMFLPVSPDAMGIDNDSGEGGSCDKDGAVKEPLLEVEPEPAGQQVEHKAAVPFLQAWRIPGVAQFALCLFFSKLVAYTFLYWLPFYISHTRIGNEYLSDATAGSLSTVFDVGGVLGGVLAGHVSDRLNARAVTAAGFTYCAIPALFLYRTYGSVSVPWNVCLMLVAGVFVNGPYALITTAVSADLGSLNGDSRALATVTAIIDGTGSVGAAVGPLLTGYISSSSWSAVFTMLMAAALLAGLLLTHLVIAEIKGKEVSSSSAVVTKGATVAQRTHSDEV